MRILIGSMSKICERHHVLEYACTAIASAHEVTPSVSLTQLGLSL